MTHSFRAIPSIEQLRQREGCRALEAVYGRESVVAALRAETDAVRERLAAGPEPGDIRGLIEQGARTRLEAWHAPSLVDVINATGVIIHTNLGRAPLAAPAAARAAAIASGYSNLEYDLDQGKRGRRDLHAERLLVRLTGAQAAVIVNNNAAATLIALAALAAGREVIISRGELVEIGGGFRVPDVMAQSGAVLREVGTTNRTRAADYAAAISDRTALILRVHPSNFRIEGFTARPALDELAALGRRFAIRVAEDLGSGFLGVPIGVPALGEEPQVAQSLGAGADVVLFSGDKLLGGPQAGIIAGTTDVVGTIRRHPLMRALRADKMTYAALEATLEEYAAGRAAQTVPVARMIAMPHEAIARRAESLALQLSATGIDASLVEGFSTIGGGSAPGTQLPTRLVAIALPAARLEATLRAQRPPVIARIENDHVVLDLRTVPPNRDDEVLAQIVAASASLLP
jgi:L-seryl-tRNA(Ser) seleniumtransferase